MTKVIHEAELAEIKDLGENSSSFVIKPLYYGYGNTLGNSLRRVLLSSIKGAAITAFRIEGTTHEFSAVPGIVEDTVDIMLNLKNIHLKSHSDTPVEIHLEKTFHHYTPPTNYTFLWIQEHVFFHILLH